MTTFSTVESLLQIALENKQAMDEAMRNADRSHQAKRRFAEVPADPSAWGHLTEPCGEGVQAPPAATDAALWNAYAEGRADEAEERESTPSDGLPLSETRKCARCNGRGEVYRPATRLYEYAVSPDDLGGYFECPECGGEGVFLIDDESEQGPQFDAPGHPGARYTWGAK